MGKYAANTTVSVVKTQSDITELVTSSGGNSVQFTDGHTYGSVSFSLGNLPVQVKINYDLDARDRGQMARQKWRSLFLTLKAKFVSINEGIETGHEAFMAHLMMSDGTKSGQKFLPQIVTSLAVTTASNTMQPSSAVEDFLRN